MTSRPIPSLPQRLRSALRERRGVSALEAALLTPLLLLVLLGAYDIGNALQQSIRLESAARAGAQYAFVNPRDTTRIKQIVRDNLPGWPANEIDVRAEVKECRCDNGSLVAAPGRTGCDTASTCSQPAVISITATRTQFQPLVPLFTERYFPSLATVKGNVEVRIY